MRRVLPSILLVVALAIPFTPMLSYAERVPRCGELFRFLRAEDAPPEQFAPFAALA